MIVWFPACNGGFQIPVAPATGDVTPSSVLFGSLHSHEIPPPTDTPTYTESKHKIQSYISDITGTSEELLLDFIYSFALRPNKLPTELFAKAVIFLICW